MHQQIPPTDIWHQITFLCSMFKIFFVNYVNFEQQQNTATRFTFFPSSNVSRPQDLWSIHSYNLWSQSLEDTEVFFLHKREYITVGKWVVVLSASGPVILILGFVKFYTWILLSCYFNLSNLILGFLKAGTWICQNWYLYFSNLLCGFSNIVETSDQSEASASLYFHILSFAFIFYKFHLNQ